MNYELQLIIGAKKFFELRELVNEAVLLEVKDKTSAKNLGELWELWSYVDSAITVIRAETPNEDEKDIVSINMASGMLSGGKMKEKITHYLGQPIFESPECRTVKTLRMITDVCELARTIVKVTVLVNVHRKMDLCKRVMERCTEMAQKIRDFDKNVSAPPIPDKKADNKQPVDNFIAMPTRH